MERHFPVVHIPRAEQVHKAGEALRKAGALGSIAGGVTANGVLLGGGIGALGLGMAVCKGAEKRMDSRDEVK